MPVAVTMGFLGDGAIGSKDLSMAVGVKINLVPPPPKPIGVVIDASSEAGVAISDVTELQQEILGGGAPPIPTDLLPNMALRGLAFKFATYDDPDIDVTIGGRLAGRFLSSLGTGTPVRELGRI